MKYSNEELVAGLPPEFLHFVNHLHSLHYHSCPDYNFLANMFGDLYARLGGTGYFYVIDVKKIEFNVIKIYLVSFPFLSLPFLPPSRKHTLRLGSPKVSRSMEG